MKIKILALLNLCIFLCLSCSENDNDNLTILNQESTFVDLSSYLSEYEIIPIEVAELYHTIQNQTDAIKEFSLLNDKYTFRVSPSKIKGELDFYSLNDSNEFEKMLIDETRTLYLDNLGLRDALGPVGMILRKDELYLEFKENEDIYVISALRELVPTAKSDEYILYKQDDILDSSELGSDCHLHTDISAELETSESTKAETRAQFNVTNTIVIDYSMHNRLGFNGSINYVNDAMFMTNFRYGTNSGLPIDIIKGSGYILNRADQYGLSYSSSPVTYLNNYAAWLSGFRIGNDASILFTSDHAHWGAAYMNTICGYNAVALVEYHSWTTRRYNIVAHEIGHILGAGHTSSRVMRTVANGESAFNSTSRNQILNYINFAGWCL